MEEEKPLVLYLVATKEAVGGALLPHGAASSHRRRRRCPPPPTLRRTALVPFLPTVTSVSPALAPCLPRSDLSQILKLTTDRVLASSSGAALRQVLRCRQELIRKVWSVTLLILPFVSSSSSVLWCDDSPDLKPAAQQVSSIHASNCFIFNDQQLFFSPTTPSGARTGLPSLSQAYQQQRLSESRTEVE
ncbi:hypothetical protein PIB30_017882 [Stylosanthes scabra]|uniref:Uncharacterized protein n=1 Tax=Stylosanthes scabra TaxID=79078 RepID=A0ABU6Y849_9FABA|nr:hypothetical protein [Stylosanthes scabra]